VEKPPAAVKVLAKYETSLDSVGECVGLRDIVLKLRIKYGRIHDYGIEIIEVPQ